MNSRLMKLLIRSLELVVLMRARRRTLKPGGSRKPAWLLEILISSDVDLIFRRGWFERRFFE